MSPAEPTLLDPAALLANQQTQTLLLPYRQQGQPGGPVTKPADPQTSRADSCTTCLTNGLPPMLARTLPARVEDAGTGWLLASYTCPLCATAWTRPWPDYAGDRSDKQLVLIEHPRPEVELRAAEDGETPAGARRLVKAASETDGWQLQVTYARGTTFDGHGRPGRLLDSIAVRLRGGSGEAAVAVWEDAKFALGWWLDAERGHVPVKARELIALVKGVDA